MIICGRETESILRLASRLEDVDVKVRWGGPQVPGALNGDCYILNGLEQMVEFTEKDFPCPEFTYERSIAERWVREGHNVIGRKLNHTQGRDIHFSGGLRNAQTNAWRNSEFWVKWVDSVNEWRFHIFDGKSIGRGKKVNLLEYQTGQSHPFPVRSRRNGFLLLHNVEPPKCLRSLAKKAVEAVGYDFGAVDVLELTDGSGVILEVNSRPAMRDEYTLSAYEKAIRTYSEER